MDSIFSASLYGAWIGPPAIAVCGVLRGAVDEVAIHAFGTATCGQHPVHGVKSNPCRDAGLHNRFVPKVRDLFASIPESFKQRGLGGEVDVHDVDGSVYI
jgi:hypothetical protein